MLFKPETPADPTQVAIIELIDKGLQANRSSQPARLYLGASAIGDECERRLAYSFHQTPKDEGADFQGRTLRIFDMGHDGEERMAEYLRLAGFNLLTHDPETGKQFGMSDAGGKFRGHLDGIVIDGPAIPGLKYPMVWENKMLGGKSWSDVQKKGLKDSKPTYYAQVQVYMGYKDAGLCLFSAINRDTGEIYIEMVNFDARECQSYIDKAVRIVSSRVPEEMGKAGRGIDDFKCKFCDYKRRCHGQAAPVEQQPAADPVPNWLRRD
jgi:hypothetical protein